MKKSVVSWKTKWRFSPLLIVLSTLIQISIVFLVLHRLFPVIWARQLKASFLTHVLIFIAIGIFQCIVEYGSHRYLLHTATISWFIKLMTSSHAKHHALTPISLLDVGYGTIKIVSSQYIVTEEKQHYAVAFPNYFFIVFFAGYAPFFAILGWLFPEAPFLISGYISLAIWLTFYDILHQWEHKPNEWWQKRKYNPLLSLLHRFHQYHHIDTRCNMAIVGFFGLPIIDWLFNTFKLLPRPLYDGQIIKTSNLISPKPRWLIAKLDSWASEREYRLLKEKRISTKLKS